MTELLQRPSSGERDDASLHQAAGSEQNEPSRPPPMVAIRRHCVDCCMGNPQEVPRCISTGCTMYLLRHGRKPTADELRAAVDEDQRRLSTGSSFKAIKAYCTGCAGSIREARACKTVICPLHPYRGGRTGRTPRVLTDEQRATLADQLARAKAKKATRQSANR